MAQYQTFPGAPGDSRTLDKLQALRLPDMAGKRFLDVGCNEGFFCGYALHEGAARSVGIDQSAGFLDRARRRFPGCEFFQQSWDRVPEGTFDVILLASALHYAEDQAGLIHSLVEALAPDGTLILEMGIASSPRAEWVEVKRGIDTRLFPSMPMMREVLRQYAWKWMGPSVLQDGDPVPRHVIHVTRSRPFAYLLMQPPAYGKTSIAKNLFTKAGLPVVSGDEVIAQVARGATAAPKVLAEALARGYSPFHIDELIRQIFEEGLGADLVDVWREAAGGGEFALDAYVPVECHGQVQSLLTKAGYLPVTLQWERVAAPLPSSVEAERRAEHFFTSLLPGEAQGLQPAVGEASPSGTFEPQGFVDEVEFRKGEVLIRGWAVEHDGELAKQLQIRLGGSWHVCNDFERQERPDVQRHFRLPRSRYGYLIRLEIRDERIEHLRGNLEVRIRSKKGPLLALAGPLK